MISLRFVWPIVGLLLFALVPTALNKYADPESLRDLLQPPGRGYRLHVQLRDPPHGGTSSE